MISWLKWLWNGRPHIHKWGAEITYITENGCCINTDRLCDCGAKYFISQIVIGDK
jgi:hypothetical protein